MPAGSPRSPAAPAGFPLPYRFLLVIGDEWKDPASYVIDQGGEFHVIAALLKCWGLPFEIARLDQQRLDRYHLLERDGTPRYGTIIWDAGARKDAGVIGELVKQHGAGLVVLGGGIASPEIAALAGVRYVSDFESEEAVLLAAPHFITRALNGAEKTFPPARKHWAGYKTVPENAAVLATRGTHPFLTAREWPGGGKVAWLGAHVSGSQMEHQVARDLLKRALVWAQGYALYQEHANAILLFMDDMGTSDKTFLSYWSYRSNPEAEIRAGLIEPLKKFKAVLMQDVNTGFVDRASQRILNPWKQERVPDAVVPGRVHDFSSTKRGLDAGLREGVFEIQSQGWTHMLPDLDSPPGPWWTAPMDGTGSLGWWTEFGDPIRKVEIPAATQLAHMRRSMEQIREDFGVTPLFIIRGGGGHSRSWPNHTARLAAQVGFGLSEFAGDEYLGPDLVINLQPVLRRGGWEHDQRISPKDIPWTADAPYYLVFHDRDLAVDPASPARLLEGLGPSVRYMSANEFCGYLHAGVERDRGSRGLALAVTYDPHYCEFFARAKSQWTLHLSDAARQALGTAAPEKQVVEVPAGLGRHVIRAASPAR